MSYYVDRPTLNGWINVVIHLDINWLIMPHYHKHNMPSGPTGAISDVIYAVFSHYRSDVA